MKIIFKLYCETVWGEEVYIQFPLEDNENVNLDSSTKMDYTENFIWTKEFIIPNTENLEFNYRYLIKDESGKETKEGRRKRNFSLVLKDTGRVKENFTILIKDIWLKQNDPLSLFYTSFFKDVSTDQKASQGGKKSYVIALEEIERIIRFTVYAPWLDTKSSIAIVGDSKEFGSWDVGNSKEMIRAGNGLWILDVITDKNFNLNYKYIVKHKEEGHIIWEEGNNRYIDISVGDVVILNDNVFRYRKLWRAAGICVPVFSIRTKKGLGTGEFSDLKTLADWASIVGFKVIQVLPVNDTTRQYGWMDAYPYSCISVFALHPLYLNIEEIGYMPEQLKKEYLKRCEELNGYMHLEYEKIMAAKIYFSKKLFELNNMEFLESEDFKIFFQKNAFWLKPYALFCTLRDKFKTADFKKWGAFSNINDEDVERFTSKESEYYRDLCFYYFLQYHLYKQLLEASIYAKEKGVAIKGDIPIGIHPESDELWHNPHLFHVDKATGAPPDAFSEHGQNWGFPTYNWEKMEEDNYSWWRERLKNMSQYFQLVRLDHILGFFRIWEIPKGFYSGMMGRFNPAIPITEDELKREGFDDDNLKRLTEPYITPWIIDEIFGETGDFVKETFLEQKVNGDFRLKSNFSNQEKINSFVGSLKEDVDKDLLRDGLFKLLSNVVLLKDEANGFHFRFNMMHTSSFKSLEDWQKQKLISLYNDYFFHRQDKIWKNTAMKRLPALKEASDMLICGEDLGMIPDCVQPVMEELCILGLRIQRMPRELNREFGSTDDYPYLTVCMTSTHDMPTLRGWWQEDKDKVARFYKYVLGHDEEPPEECTPEITKEIILQHLKSPSMLAIFPVQDILAMSETLRYTGNLADEQINNPADPYHKWNYRMHITVEELLKHDAFNDMLKDMLIKSSRLGFEKYKT